MITIKSKARDYSINFPTDVNEITAHHLNVITASANIPAHYCIVALCFKTKLFDFAAMVRNNSGGSVSVVPLLAKVNKEDAGFANVGDRIIVDKTDLERGSHINFKTMISSNNAKAYINSDPELIRGILSKKDIPLNESLKLSQSPYIVVVEFKIIPVNDIHAAIPRDSKSEDPFMIK